MDRKTDRQTQVEISTIHKSRERLGRVDSGETTVEKRKDVKNSVLPRWRSAAIIQIPTRSEFNGWCTWITNIPERSRMICLKLEYGMIKKRKTTLARLLQARIHHVL